MEPTKILIVEDEPKVAAFLKTGLEENGYATDVAYDGIIGKALSLSNKYHLIILDLNIPHINGFQLCKIIRENNLKVPILMLTALGGINDKIQGFEAGADDYLLKPFEVRELILRIKALLKRSSDTAPVSEILRIADLEFYPNEKKVIRAGKIIHLRAKEYFLLEFLIQNKDRILDRLEISEQVWGINFDTGTNVVDVYINFLRKKIDYDFEPKLIHTRIGLGYIFTDNPD
jgi:DNA-binding response OmpR family regulator